MPWQSPWIYPGAQLCFLTPRSPISWLQEEVPLGSAAQSHPTWGEVGRRVKGSAVPQESPRAKCQATSSRRDQPSQRAARFAAIPVAAASAGAAVASETVCTPGSCTRRGQPGLLGTPGQLSPPALGPGWPGAPSSPCMNVYFIRTDADHGI